jgi:acylphosphatase
MKAIHCIIHGRVQGVGYRAWTAKNAQKLGLSGWVRNRTDGTVEAVFAGDDTIVDEMLDACKKGPLAARVKQIDATKWTDEVKAEFTPLATA